MANGRLAYRIGEIAELTGLPRSTIVREIERKGVRRKHIGRSLVLDPADVERVFGFSRETAPLPSPTREDLALARELLR